MRCPRRPQRSVGSAKSWAGGQIQPPVTPPLHPPFPTKSAIQTFAATFNAKSQSRQDAKTEKPFARPCAFALNIPFPSVLNPLRKAATLTECAAKPSRPAKRGERGTSFAPFAPFRVQPSPISAFQLFSLSAFFFSLSVEKPLTNRPKDARNHQPLDLVRDTCRP